MERQEVYGLINDERAYQDNKFPHTKGEDETTPIANWILYMKHQLTKAERDIYSLDIQQALRRIRKATALGVACMENHETPPR